VILSTDDVTDFDVSDGRYDAVARLLNEDEHATWPSLTAEAQLGIGHKVLTISVVT